MKILGISAYYHDSAATLVADGRIVAAAQEERFTRRKHDSSLPVNAIRYCLAEGGIDAAGLDAVSFYEKPVTKFSRILKTYFSVAPGGFRSFLMAMPMWINEKLWIPLNIEKAMEACGARKALPIWYPEHHESHAASAFYPSPFNRAAILTLDGVGEWATSSLAHGVGSEIKLMKEMRFPHSLGLLYSAFTYFCGFKVNSGEYKLMGLAPYGEPRYVKTIYEELLDLKEDGSFVLNMKKFGYLDGLTMTNDSFADLFNGPPRKPESEITRREMDLAASIQSVTEEIVLRMARHAKTLTGENRLCLGGGVALNCVSNGKLLRSGLFKDIWIQPAAGDAGGALGAALCIWHKLSKEERTPNGEKDAMQGSYLGPAFGDAGIEKFLDDHKYPALRPAPAAWAGEIARLIDEQNVIGLFNGRMEFGPRALGNRSIIGDARSAEMQSVMNLKIKHRESFRPFAPACLDERVSDYFELDRPSPYMLLVAGLKPELRRQADAGLSVRERVNQIRSTIPAVTHVDYSARVQTVSAATNKPFHDIISEFEKRTGCGVIINTSFNVRGEPIVCTPEDAYRCFMRTEMDFLVLGPFILDKKKQPLCREAGDWKKEFVLD